MGIRCSIFGCEYEGTEIERDEERRGSEVVTTVREYEECVRCGSVRVVSENTGVTTVDSAGRPGGAPAGDAPSESDDAGPGEVIVEAEPGAATPDHHGDASGAGDAPTDTGEATADAGSAGGSGGAPLGTGGVGETPGSDPGADPGGTADPGGASDPGGVPGNDPDAGEVTDDAVFLGESDGPSDPGPDGDDPATADAGGGSPADEAGDAPVDAAPDGTPADAARDGTPGDADDPEAGGPVEPHPDEDVEFIGSGPGDDGSSGGSAPDAGGPDDGSGAGTPDEGVLDAGGPGSPSADDADPADDAGPTADPGDPGATADPGDAGATADPGATDDADAEIIDDEPPSLADAISEAEGEVTDATDRPDDDALILEEGSPDRPDPGRSELPEDSVTDREWPTFEDDDRSGLSAQYDDWPDDEGPGTAGATDPADADPEGSAEFVGGSPDSTGSDPADGAATVDAGVAGNAADPGPNGTGADGDEVARAAPAADGPRTDGDWATGGAATAGPELHCPECGRSWTTGETPHRAGDSCPECSRGYLTER